MNSPQEADTRAQQIVPRRSSLLRQLPGLIALYLAVSSTVGFFTAQTIKLECERESARCVFGGHAVELREVQDLELQDERALDPHIIDDESEGAHYRVVALLRDGSRIPASEQFFPDAREKKIVADFKEFAFKELPSFSGAYGESQEACAGFAMIFFTLASLAFALQIDWRRVLRFRRP